MSALFEVDCCATSLTHFHNSDGMSFLSELKKFSNTHSRIMCIKGGLYFDNIEPRLRDVLY